MKRTLTMFLTLVAVALFLAAGCGGNKTKDGDAKTKDGNGKTQDGNGKTQDGQEAQPAAKKAPAKLSEKLVGTWEGGMSIPDENRLRADIKAGIEADGGTADEATLQKEIDAIKAMKITMTFNADGTGLSKTEGVGPEPIEEPGKWEVVEQNDKQITLKLTAEGEPDQEVILVFDGDDRFTMAAPIPGVTASFNRKK